MPSYQEWVRKIDINIDYYSAFIKSWIAFNSWYRSEYTERTDRGIIEKLKTENNRFKGYIETMLDENNNSDEAIIFKKNLKDLQAALVNAAIVTQVLMATLDGNTKTLLPVSELPCILSLIQ